jgi:hypothetical protein
MYTAVVENKSLRWIAIDKKWEYNGNSIKMDDFGVPGF